jgi:hypothetical protein
MPWVHDLQEKDPDAARQQWIDASWDDLLILCPPALKVSQCSCYDCRHRKNMEKTKNGYYFPRKTLQLAPPPRGPATETVRELIGYEYLKPWDRELLDSKHLTNDDRLKIATLLFGNGISPELMWEYFEENKSLWDDSAVRTMKWILDTLASGERRRQYRAWDVVERKVMYMDGQEYLSKKQLEEREQATATTATTTTATTTTTTAKKMAKNMADAVAWGMQPIPKPLTYAQRESRRKYRKRNKERQQQKRL